MIDWTYFEIPADLQRKISRAGVRKEVVILFAKNILTAFDLYEKIELITERERKFARLLAEFWSQKYKKVLKKAPKKHLSNSSKKAPQKDLCTICKGKKVLFDGQKEYPCPACAKKKKSRSVPKLGERKVQISD